MFFPSPYELNQFNHIEVCDENGQLLFKSCDKLVVGKWLIDNDMIRTTEVGDYYDPENGTVCFFNAKKVER